MKDTKLVERLLGYWNALRLHLYRSLRALGMTHRFYVLHLLVCRFPDFAQFELMVQGKNLRHQQSLMLHLDGIGLYPM